MSSKENKAITRRDIDEAWRQGNIDILDVFKSSNSAITAKHEREFLSEKPVTWNAAL
jgi:hypothetical protein